LIHAYTSYLLISLQLLNGTRNYKCFMKPEDSVLCSSLDLYLSRLNLIHNLMSCFCKIRFNTVDDSGIRGGFF